MNFRKISITALIIAAYSSNHLHSQDSDSIVDLPPYRVKSYWFEPKQQKDEQTTYSHANLGEHHSSDIASILQQATPDIGIIRKAGTSNDIIIRGLSQDNLTLTIDDGKIFPCCSNRMDPPVSQVSSTMVEAIEFTQGAFDLSSAGSLGGAVKITTKEPSATPSLKSIFSYASFDQMSATVIGTGGNSNFSTLFIGEYSQSAPYEDGDGNRLTDGPDSSDWTIDDYLEKDRDMTAFKAAHAAIKANWNVTQNSIVKGSYRYRRDEDVLYPGLRMDADLTQTHEFGATYQKQPSMRSDYGIDLHLYHNWTRHDMRDSHRKSSILNPMGKARPQYVLDRGYFMESLATGSTTGLNFKFNKDWDKTLLEMGLEYTRRDWDINNRLGGGMPTSGPAAEIFNDMIPDTESHVSGIFVQTEHWLSDVSRIDVGVRWDQFETKTNDPTDFLLSQRPGQNSTSESVPSAKLVYRHHLTEDLSMFVGVGSTSRIPNGQERYIQLKRTGTMPNWLGNPNLKSPRNTEFIIGASYENDTFSWNAKAFYSDLNDYIYMGRISPNDHPSLSKTTQSYFNIDAHLFGVDSSLTIRLSEHFSWYNGVAWQRGKKDSFTPNNPSENLSEIPPVKGMSIINYHGKSSDYSLEMLFAGSQTDIDTHLGEVEIDGYAVLNLRARFQINDKLFVSAGVENLMDETYATHNNLVRNPFSTFTIVNEPGRVFFVSFEGTW